MDNKSDLPQNLAGQLEGLKHALYLIECRRGLLNRNSSYLAARDDMKIFLEAAIERVEMGENMYSVAYTQ